jgi:hypothetical protein
MPLMHRNHKLAVIEAKARDKAATEGVGQAKRYAAKLGVRFAFSTNGVGIYRIDMQTGAEAYVPHYPGPDDLWNETFAEPNAWHDRFAAPQPQRPNNRVVEGPPRPIWAVCGPSGPFRGAFSNGSGTGEQRLPGCQRGGDAERVSADPEAVPPAGRCQGERHRRVRLNLVSVSR